MDNQTPRRTKLFCPILTSIFFSNVSSIYFHWTHGQTDTLRKWTFNNHQLSNSNFNILLKCILHLFSLDIRTRQTDRTNFYWTHTTSTFNIYWLGRLVATQISIVHWLQQCYLHTSQHQRQWLQWLYSDKVSIVLGHLLQIMLSV